MLASSATSLLLMVTALRRGGEKRLTLIGRDRSAREVGQILSQVVVLSHHYAVNTVRHHSSTGDECLHRVTMSSMRSMGTTPVE